MTGTYSPSKMWVIGIFAAVIGVLGFVVFGWRFGESDGQLPFILGVSFAGLAIVWTLAQRLSDRTS